MLGTQRRIEAKIGQLLGEPEPGKRTDLEPLGHNREVKIPKDARNDFRILALGRDQGLKILIMMRI